MSAGGSANFGADMTVGDDDFRVRPGRSRDAGKGSGRKVQSLAAQVRRAAAKAGYSRRGPSRGKGTGRHGRGRLARLDRQSVVSGKGVSVRVDPGRRRNIQKTTQAKHVGTQCYHYKPLENIR